MNERKKRISNTELVADFRSPLLTVAAVFLTAAMICAAPGFIQVFNQTLSTRILALLALDFVDPAICRSWLNVWRIIQIVTFILPIPMVIGLWVSVADMYSTEKEKSMPLRCIRYFVRAVRVARVVLWAVTVLLAAAFVFRLVRYVVLNAPTLGGILFILVTLLLEGIFGIAVAVVLVLVIRCMNSAVHTADTIHYNMLMGTCDSYGFNAAPSAFMIGLGVVALVLCFVARGYLFAMLSYICFAAGMFLMSAWLHGYRRKNGNRAIEMLRKENG